jgi:hypothetical protein
MSRELKVGDRVETNVPRNGLKEGSTGTIMQLPWVGDIDAVFINSDKLNNYNHSRFNGNGVIMDISWLELLYKTGKWTVEDINYLHSYYRRKSITDIAEHLKRSYYSVQSKARSEGIHKHPRREYNANDNHFIVHNRVDNMSINLIGRKLHRSKSSIGSRLDLMIERGMVPTIKVKL